jgi:hypothetical protein
VIGRALLAASLAVLLAALTAACTPQHRATAVLREPVHRSASTNTQEPAHTRSATAEERAGDAELLRTCRVLEPRDLEPNGLQRTAFILLRTARTSQELRCLRMFSERFFPELARRRPLPTDPELFGDWWKTVGQSAVNESFGPDKLVVLPEARPVLHAASDLERLAPLLCSARAPTCGLGARAFLADAEHQMAHLAGLRVLADELEEGREIGRSVPNDDERLADCEVLARAAEKRHAFAEWRACVEGLVPTVTRVPSNRFRMPRTGTLVTHLYGFWRPCRDVTAYSLDSGMVLNRVSCGTRKQPIVRWSLAQVHPGALRRVALFAALMQTMQDSPAYARAFDIPANLEDDGSIIRSFRGGHVTDVPEIWYTFYDVLDTPFSDSVYVDHEREPRRRFLADGLHALQDAGQVRCAKEEDRAMVERLLEKLRDRSKLMPDAKPTSVFDEVRCA